MSNPDDERAAIAAENERDNATLARIKTRGEEIQADIDRQRRAAKEALAYIRRESDELPIDASWGITADMVLEIKSADEDERRITGIATTPTVDRMGEVVDPLGCTFEETIPLFLNHDSAKVIGTAHLGEPTERGIPFVAYVAKIAQAGTLKDRCDEAWLSVKSGLLRHVSIGFRPLAVDAEAKRRGEGRIYAACEILELSLVPIPAQPDAKITGFKSADPQTTAASVSLVPREHDELLGAVYDAAMDGYRDEKRELEGRPGKDHAVQLTQRLYETLYTLPQKAMLSALTASVAFSMRTGSRIERGLRAEIATRDAAIVMLTKRLDRQAEHLKALDRRTKSMKGTTSE